MAAGGSQPAAHWARAGTAKVSKRARDTTHWRIAVVALSATLVAFVALQSEVVPE